MSPRVGKAVLLLSVVGTLVLGIGGCDDKGAGYQSRHDRSDHGARNDRYGGYDNSGYHYSGGGYDDSGYRFDDERYGDNFNGYYDAYYDGYYGRYLGGYWASDDYFHYWGPDGRYHRDDGNHFRRERFRDAKLVRGDLGRRRRNLRDGDRDDT